MLASDFAGPPARPFPPAAKIASYGLLYGVLVPVARAFEAFGKWPEIAVRRIAKSKGTFAGYEPSPGDVFTCSFFKSGTSWMVQIALQIAWRGKAEFANLHDAVPWPDCPPNLRARIIPLDNPSPAQLSPTGLRVIKTHYPLAEVPFAPQSRYIAVVRDPKEVCVSGYFFLRSLIFGPMMPSMSRWIDYFLSSDFEQGSWARHLASYWTIRDKPNVVFLTYGEMKQDLPGAVSRVAKLMGVSLSAAEHASVVERSEFTWMKREGAKFDPGKLLPWSNEAPLLRKGKQGGWAEALTKEQAARIDDTCEAELQRLGCDFPYKRYFPTFEG